MNTILRFSSIGVAALFWGYILNFYGGLGYDRIVHGVAVDSFFHAVILAVLVAGSVILTTIVVVIGTIELFKLVRGWV